MGINNIRLYIMEKDGLYLYLSNFRLIKNLQNEADSDIQFLRSLLRLYIYIFFSVDIDIP